MWTQPANAPAVTPRIRIKLNRDGTLNGVPEVDNPSDGPAFTAYAKSAIVAGLRAAPFDLAAYSSSYDQWKTVVHPFATGGTATAGSSGGVSTAGMTTTANLSRAYKTDGNAINSLTLYKPMTDGNPVLALAFCGAGDIKGSFALGVDFGKGMVWKQPEPVLVSFGRHGEKHTMKVM